MITARGRRAGLLLACLVTTVAGCSSVAHAPGGATAPPTSTAPAPATTTSPAAATADLAAVLPPSGCPEGAQATTLPTAAGTVAVLTWGEGDRVVLLSHQVDGSRCDLADLGAELARRGHRVLAVQPGDDAVAQLVAVTDAVRADGATEVVLVGASIGAATSLAAAGTATPPVDAVVSLSTVDVVRGGAPVAEPFAGYPGPVLFLVAEGDRPAAEATEALAGVARGPQEVVVVDGRRHGRSLLRSLEPRAAELAGRALEAVDDPASIG